MKIEVNGVELMINATVKGRRTYVSVKRVVGRDRKRKLDITSGIDTQMESVAHLVELLERVAAMQTARCTCGYSYGYSDHAEHCRSIHVAKEYVDYDD